MKKALVFAPCRSAAWVLCLFVLPSLVLAPFAAAATDLLACDTVDCAAGYYCVESPQGPTCVCACPSGYHCESPDFVNTECVRDQVCPATVFNGYDVIRLGSGKPAWFAFVQPVSGCYANTDVIPSSFVLMYAGRQISASAGKTLVVGDKSGDGIQEIRVSFSKTDLRTLFTGTDLGNGHNFVTMTIEANLVTGGTLQGTTQADVFNNGSFTSAMVSPNPLNPSATLTFRTARPGSAKVEMFDITGRLVRTILDERSLAPGVHEVRIEAGDGRGESLASGIYFIRGLSAEGEFTKRIAILK